MKVSLIEVSKIYLRWEGDDCIITSEQPLEIYPLTQATRAAARVRELNADIPLDDKRLYSYNSDLFKVELNLTLENIN